MSVVPWSDIGDTSIIDNDDKIGIFKPSGATEADKFKLLLLSAIRQTPENTVYAKNQTELEEKLGTDLIIPAGVAVTVIIDKSFSTSKPFKKQAGSSLLLKSQLSDVTLTYTGTGALIQMDNPGVDIGKLTQFDNITLAGNFTNQCFAIEDNFFDTFENTQIITFASVGFLKGMSVIWDKSAIFFCLQGITFFNNPTVDIFRATSQNSGLPQQTLMNFITTTKTDVVIRNQIYTSDNIDYLLFFDPNSDVTSSYTVRDSGIIAPLPDRLFQKGGDEPATALSASGGNTLFDIFNHDLVNGQYTVLKGFVGQPGYNGTFLVIDADSSPNEVVIAVPFTAVDSSGTMNAASLDSVEPRVEAFSNPDQPNSMSIAESRSLAAISFLSVVTTDVAIQNTTPAPNDFVEDPATERFTVDDETGIITYIGLEPITSAIIFEFLLSKTGGGTDTATVSLFQNATQQVKTNQLASITSTAQKVSYNGGIFDINPGDTFQLFINSDSASTLSVSALKVLITKQ